MGINEITIVLFLILVLDLVLILRWRKRGEPTDSSQQVRLFGAYSPVLTWLKYRRLPDSNRTQKEIKTSQISDENPAGESSQKRGWKPLQVLAHYVHSGSGVRFKMRMPSTEWAEVLLIATVALIYAHPFLLLHPSLGLPGNEYQAHVGKITLFNRWFAGEIDFPLWNPVLGNGRTLIADPFLFFFNPFLSLPMAIFGVVTGSKIAALLNFFIAGLGMWLLARELKFHRLTRLWTSLLYMMSGAIPAHIYGGHLQLAFALGWLPWSILGLVWVIHRRSVGAVLLASLAQALFFFTGNLYYQLFSLFCMVILGVSFAVDWRRFRIKKGIAARILLMGILSLGLISIQLLPEIASRSDIHNLGGYLPDEIEYHGSQRPENAIVNYFVSDMEFYKNRTLGKAPYPQESYRYIGIIPFLLLLFLVPAFKRGNRKEIITFLLCFLFMLAWTDIRYSFVKTIYNTLPFLNQFRWPGRALSVGGLFLILTSAYCLDHVIEVAQNSTRFAPTSTERGTGLSGAQTYTLFSLLLVLILFLATRHVHLKNQEFILLDKLIEPEVKVGLTWLTNKESEEFSVYTTGSIATRSALEIYNLGLRSPTIVDGWVPAVADQLTGKPDAITLSPKYTLSWEWDDIDHSTQAHVNSIGPLQIWRNFDTFPYAFLVPVKRVFSEVPINSGVARPALSVTRDGCNRILVESQVIEESFLIVSESWFSGWKVSVDHEPAEILSVSSLLAVQLSPGHHSVVFSYSPASFKIGAIISGLTLLLIILGLIWEGLRVYRTRYPIADNG